MSWLNPSKEEASEAYYSNRNTYNDAAVAKRTSEREEQEYVSQRSAAQTQIFNANRDRLNFEKRLEGIKKIIAMLEGNSGLFSVKVPTTITKANKALDTVENSYHKCIKVTGGANTASLVNVFKTDTVEGESHSASALSDLKKEAARLESAIADTKRQISNLQNTVGDLNNKIRACNNTQAALQRKMNACSFEMAHYSYHM